MENKIFYVKANDSIPTKLAEDLVYDIKIDDINSLALFATTLKPEDGITDAQGYVSALFSYFQINKDINHFSECYKKITSSNWGEQFLYTTILLFLLEKELRINGISEGIIDKYNKVVADYQKQINFSKELCQISREKINR